ncbi:uncharacterized protein BDR25DRAFT_53492 [Lindgomyces ingoldianus]|uniref:Uncharacterized protein n=1 Tax=Lindgomyces ingoldianus TaxID=673940 RepID=A0ACB6QRC1_9PLEO|nr:uncharacterized protein BDR25DRAFT_53492 [Lindgomyces ingoldianus]KAF2468837.1 hypothetical protein BDR25DRAFT_53492 [Lindgomyces ingoldianus]
MSLNGLDDAKVAEAYQGALAEAGGWFLLKYASRDAVEVLTRGTGGAAETRGAVAQYEEKSPLYGFLLYRRRKVLIKCIPEGTSRLLQARVAVHFQAVTEKFTPHDTILSITSGDELSDAALISACSLHTAAPSSCSSSGSSRRNKLDEITEDVEEGQGTLVDAVSPPRPATAASSIPTIIEPTNAEGKIETKVPEKPATSESLPPLSTHNEPNAAQGSNPTLSHGTIEAVSERNDPELKTENYRDSLKHYDALFEHGPDPRLSSQTTRPALSDLYSELYAQYKPKVKLGPRPRPSLDSKRPHTSGNGAQNPARPVSSLPAGLRVASRKTMEPRRPKSRDSSIVPSIAFPPPPPVPSIPDMPLPSPTYPPKSPASVRSMPIHGYGHGSSGMTPEKRRLMKALELRKKQLKAQKEREEKEAEALSQEASAASDDSVTKKDAQAAANPLMETVNEEAGPVDNPEQEPATASYKNDELSSKQEGPNLASNQSSNSPEDLSAHMTNSHTETDDQHSAASPCSPTSAQTQGSSDAPSTRPSSISEDDQVVCEANEKPESIQSLPHQGSDNAAELSQNEDEKNSVESSPTVVPDTDSSVPRVEVTVQSSEEPQGSSTQDDTLARRKNRESMVLMTLGDQGDAHSRKSKRESMIFFPSNDQAPHDALASKKEKRESMILSVPKRKSFVEVKEKRRVMVDPIQIHLSAENSDAEYLSDDSFMEELQSAKLEEAKPVSVSKSPMSQYFPRTSSISEVTIPERSSSAQYKPGRLTPDQLGERKSSGSWLPYANTDSAVTAKKINVSSGISQRIKALAEKSTRDSLVSVSPITTPDASHSIVAQRKSSFFSTPPAGNSPNGLPIKRLSRASFATLSNSTTPDRKPVLQPSPPSTEQTMYNVQKESEKPRSVQVTARIVRDSRIHKPSLAMPTENTPLELHQSPIIIDHQKYTQPTSSTKPIPPKMEPTSPRPPSSSHSREASATSALPRSSSESSWRSFGRRLSESKPSSATRSQSTHSFESLDDKREEKKDKKDSRTSKLFKRMSSISRKNGGISPVLAEEDYPATMLPSLREPPPAVQVGDLNVQFPDTLLWKRRWVEVDSMGNLVLSLSRANEQSKGIIKRFHLGEFRTPYAPDQDRQELPNSVVLDFIDGRTLQCACETYVAQIQVLQILREAHEAWLAYGQLA